MKTLITLLANHTSTCNKRFQTIQERVMKELQDNNAGLIPNVDCLGRLHASCDSYNDVNDNVYLKGQFIPMPETEDDCFFGVPVSSKEIKTRIQIFGSLITDINELIDLNTVLNGITFGLGKTFKKSGLDTCFLYVNAASHGYLNITRDFIETKLQEIKDKIELETPAKLKGVAPEGKQSIQGVVLGTPVVEDFYGYTCKVFVELENGSTVYGTLPSKICDVEIGETIAFTANFNHALDDNTHAFFKRPSKPSIVSVQNG